MTRAEEELLITSRAAEQHGLVTRTELLELGISARVVDCRVAANRLRPVQRGVYQVGPVELPGAREMAAVLACGGRAHVSHESVGAMWNLIRTDAGTPVHVTVTGVNCGRRPGIRVHRVTRLEPPDVTTIDGIPVTAPARTLIDLASVLRGRELEQAVARALDMRTVVESELLSRIDAHPKRRGIHVLRRILESQAGPALARSDAEERFLALIRKAGLPTPKVNVRIEQYEVDFLWHRENFIVEVNGFAYHSSPRSFETDRRRDAKLVAAGYSLMRVTWRQIVHEPEMLLVDLAQTLTRIRFSSNKG